MSALTLTVIFLIGLILFFDARISAVLKEIKEIRKLIEFAEVPIPAIEFYTTMDGQEQRITTMMLKVSQKLPVSIQIKDKFGNAASVEGVPAWAVTDMNLGALTVAADGLSAEFVPSGPIGSLKVQVSADADLGAGVKTILGELPVDLLAGEAVEVAITAGVAIDQ